MSLAGTCERTGIRQDQQVRKKTGVSLRPTGGNDTPA
jgi:hypothetical protein